MAEYYAHYRTIFKKANGSLGNDWTDTYPVIGYTDTCLVVDGDGTVLTVNALLEQLGKGGGTPDADGETFSVTLEVNAWDGEE